MLIRQSDVDSGIHIDFVPMVDVLFNLVIFFLLATTIAQVEREMNIALPAAASAAPITTALREITINVEADVDTRLRAADVSTTVNSDVGIVVERAAAPGA